MIQSADLTLLIQCVIIGVGGLTVNGFLLFLIISNKDLRRKDYICFILNHTLIDFIYCITLITLHPFTIYDGSEKSTLCSVAGFLEVAFSTVSVYTEPVLALNRFISIFHSCLYKKIYKSSYVCVMCALIILVGCLSALPHLLVGSLGRIGGSLCSIKFSQNALIVSVAANFIPTFIGLFVLAYCNVKIFRFLNHHQNQTISSQHRSQLQKDREIARFIIVAALVPLCLSSPVMILSMVRMLVDTSDWLSFAGMGLFIVSFIINPCIALYMVKPLRNECMKVWGRALGKVTSVEIIAVSGRRFITK
jgi:hypothetical protein